jgi:hypothetical protein
LVRLDALDVRSELAVNLEPNWTNEVDGRHGTRAAGE